MNTGFEYKIPVDGKILPKNIPARRLPPAVMEPVREEMKRMEHNNVIRPITEPTKWCSPMLVTRKSGDIRLVVDFRELNKSVQRQTYQIPQLDDMLPLLKNSKLFSSLDGVSGYLQIPVHAVSVDLTGPSPLFDDAVVLTAIDYFSRYPIRVHFEKRHFEGDHRLPVASFFTIWSARGNNFGQWHSLRLG